MRSMKQSRIAERWRKRKRLEGYDEATLAHHGTTPTHTTTTRARTDRMRRARRVLLAWAPPRFLLLALLLLLLAAAATAAVAEDAGKRATRIGGMRVYVYTRAWGMRVRPAIAADR